MNIVSAGFANLGRTGLTLPVEPGSAYQVVLIASSWGKIPFFLAEGDEVKVGPLAFQVDDSRSSWSGGVKISNPKSCLDLSQPKGRVEVE